jgi:uncharacterized membrane protein YfcA
MPYVNLIVAQGASAWIASPYLVALGLSPDDTTLGPYFWPIIAATSGLIVWIGALIGSRVTRTIRRPTFLTLVTTIGFALIGYVVAATFFAPHIEEQRVWGELFTVTPVAAALLGYMLHRGTESV